MSRPAAVREGGFYGFVGVALLALGNLLAGAALAGLDYWVGVPLALLAWAGCVYFGTRQLAAAVYVVVADASAD